MPGTPFRIVILGDSLTAFSWYQYLASMCAAQQVATTPDPFGNFPFKKLTTGTGPHLWINSGVAGNDCTNFLQDTIAARVTAFKPDLVIVECGINCQQHAQSPVLGPGTTGILTIDSVCQVNHPLIIAQIQAQNPLAQVVWVGPLCNGENWPLGANGADLATYGVEAKDAINAAACAGATIPILYISFRGANGPFFTYQAANNPSHLPSNILTGLGDGIHPTIVPNAGQPLSGQQLMANVVYPFCAFS